MKEKYCLPIIKSTFTEVEQTINKNILNYHYFEVWLDYIVDLEKHDIKRIIDRLNGRIIFLFRRKNFEELKLPGIQRIEIMHLLTNTTAYIDLDIQNQAQEIAYMKQQKLPVKCIISYHNYNETPRIKELEKVIAKMEQINPSMYKLATLCKDPQDAITLLQIQQQLIKKEKRHIVLGMGKHGMITRVFGTLWGNEIVFAPLQKSEESALGQLTGGELERVFSVLQI